MRTKHVLMTTALMALFAACADDDFISSEQGIQNGDAALRPTVDVTLNVLENGLADTKLVYNGKYKFDDTDVIGALLMDKLVGTERPFDNLNAWEEKPWLQRYELVDYINTDYPFNRNNGQWSTPAKMLEGNYFFTLPFASYDGNREAVHSIGEQVQNGTNTLQAFADNQFFIGYSRIFAGTQGEEVMSANLEMIPTLGPVGITIKNVGTGELKVKKIVLATDIAETDLAAGHKGLSTLIKIDPTNARYFGQKEDASGDPANSNGYNLDYIKLSDWADEGTNAAYFNYANYEEMNNVSGEWAFNEEFEEEYGDGTLVNNTKKSDNYQRREALRAVVKGVDGADQRAELTVNNAPTLKSQETANFIIMTNAYKYEKWNDGTDKDNAIYAYVYTEKGMVGPVALSGINFETGNEDQAKEEGLTVITNTQLMEINPNVTNLVSLAIDDNSNQAPVKMDIYNESDLEQFIEWNEGQARVYTAELKKDVTLTPEMSKSLTSGNWADAKLVINTGDDFKLTLADGVANNILDYIFVDGNVEVLEDLTLGTNSYVNGEYKFSKLSTVSNIRVDKQKLSIAEGVTVTVASPIDSKNTGDLLNQALNIAKNEGTLTFDKDVKDLTVTSNEGVMNVNATVTFTATGNVNQPGAIINISATGVLNAGTATPANYLTNGTSTLNDDEYAIINNDGKIYNLANGKSGKVIVGKKNGMVVSTHVNSNAGVIDITNDIDAQLSGAYTNGTLAYTVNKGTSVTMAKVAEKKITELTVDGGSVTSADNTEAAAKTPSLAKVIVTEQGGTIGGATESTFSNTGVEVEINGDATLQNLTIAGDEILVKNGQTIIMGTVDAKGATVTLGSYDDKTYEKYGASLNIPAGNNKLVVADIKKDSNTDVKKEEVIVYNEGTVALPEGVTTNEVTWRGTGSIEQDKVETPVDVTIDGVGTDTNAYTNLDALKTAIDGGLVVGKITISTAVSVTKDNFSVLNNKNIELGANLTIDNYEWAPSVKSLTVTAAATVTGNINQPGLVYLKAQKIDYSAAKLTISGGRIQYNGSDAATVGGSTPNIIGAENNLDGTIVSTNNLQWDKATSTWKSLE